MKVVELFSYKEIEGKWQPYKVRRLSFVPLEYNDTNVQWASEKILEKLNPSYLTKRYVEENKWNPTYGHCYHTTQAMFYMFDTDRLVPMRGEDTRNEYHWWLQDGKKVIDPTADQYFRRNEKPPYDKGKKGQWYAWRRQPSSRSFRLIVNVLGNVNDVTESIVNAS
jgi:hypothetical protein